jgi:AhpD family alkylhydroperoxidase
MESFVNTFPFPTIDNAAPDARPFLEGAQKQRGFVPNLLSGLSNSPATLASHVDLSKHFAKVGLTGIEMQTALVVTSVENACAYCVSAHSTLATNMKIDPAVLKAIRHGTESPDAKLNALATFVRKLIRTKGHGTEADSNSFIAAGCTREQGLGALIGVAMKTIGNFANHFRKTPIDQQFTAQRWERQSATTW